MATAILLLVVIRIFILQPERVASESMQPTLTPGDVIVLNKLGPTLDGIHTGDLVTVASPASGEFIVKRVVATGGQTVEMYGGELVVDGDVVHESYVDMHNMSGIFFGPVAVPEGRVFLMGDNRLASIDSRDFGPVNVGTIEGTVLLTLPLGARE